MIAAADAAPAMTGDMDLQRLYAVVDLATASDLLDLLADHDGLQCSLIGDSLGAEALPFAPILVHVPEDGPLLRRLLAADTMADGRPWGCFLRVDQDEPDPLALAHRLAARFWLHDRGYPRLWRWWDRRIWWQEEQSDGPLSRYHPQRLLDPGDELLVPVPGGMLRITAAHTSARL